MKDIQIKQSLPGGERRVGSAVPATAPRTEFPFRFWTGCVVCAPGANAALQRCTARRSMRSARLISRSEQSAPAALTFRKPHQPQLQQSLPLWFQTGMWTIRGMRPRSRVTSPRSQAGDLGKYAMPWRQRGCRNTSYQRLLLRQTHLHRHQGWRRCLR